MMPADLAAFDALCTEIVAANTGADRQALVDAFFVQHPHTPFVGADAAAIVYVGAAHEVLLRGDMLQERSEPLTRVADTNLWAHRASYEPDARLDYHLLVDGVDVGDPRNPRATPSGYGPRAELRMPRWSGFELDHWPDDRAHPRVRLHENVRSTLYPSTRNVWVYTPPHYDAAQQYPVLYFNDGGDYLYFAGAATLLDYLISVQTIPPCVAVFVDPSIEHTRVVDYDLNDAYVRFLCDELVPWIDQRYATARDPARRAIIGASFGGLIALHAAHQRPEVFGLVGSQSGFVGRRDDTLIKNVAATPQPLKIHLIVGTYETEVGGAFTSVAEADFVRANRALRDVLAAQQGDFAYAEYHDGHAWALWRASLPDMLRFLLNAPDAVHR